VLDRRNALVVDLTRRCLAKILGSMPAEQVLAALLPPILESRADDRTMVVKVAPAWQAAARAVLAGRGAAALTVSVEPDPALTPGDCIAYTPRAIIDLSIDIQIASLCRAMGGDPHAEADSEPDEDAP